MHARTLSKTIIAWSAACCAVVLAASACAPGGSAQPTPGASAAAAVTSAPPAQSRSPVTPTAAPPKPASPAPTPDPVVLTSDIAFADTVAAPVAWSKPLLDLYVPATRASWTTSPLIVILPAHSVTKDAAHVWAYVAKALVLHGAVVAVANWTQLEDPADEFTDPAVLAQMASLGQSVATCAISMATDLGAKAGADTARTVVVGELYGANTAVMAVMGKPAPLPGCKSTTKSTVQGLVPVDADLIAGYPAWDPLGKEAHRAVDALTPWKLLNTAPTLRLRLVVADDAVTVSKRCGGRTADWLVARDPKGTMRKWLATVRAFDDGCVDFGDAANAFALATRETPLQAALLAPLGGDPGTFLDSSGQLTDIGLEDLELLDRAILTSAGLDLP
ncbi:MAG: hypothetical protein U0838_17400 [Chloroflexota bacterium]